MFCRLEFVLLDVRLLSRSLEPLTVKTFSDLVRSGQVMGHKFTIGSMLGVDQWRTQDYFGGVNFN